MTLKTEQNTVTMEKRILRAFHRASVDGSTRANPATAVFEHGHWWVVLRNGQQFSVEDAEGGNSVDGFDFEQVAEGEEE